MATSLHREISKSSNFFSTPILLKVYCIASLLLFGELSYGDKCEDAWNASSAHNSCYLNTPITTTQPADPSRGDIYCVVNVKCLTGNTVPMDPDNLKSREIREKKDSIRNILPDTLKYMNNCDGVLERICE
jgi:hypothetical protein